jgi:hypothetical protein
VVEAKDDSPLPRLYCLDRTEGKGTVPPWEEAAPSNDDRVGVVCVPLVADVVEPTDLRAVDCHDPVALGGGEQATELRLPDQALLGTLIADSLVHGEKRSPLPHSTPQGPRSDRTNHSSRPPLCRSTREESQSDDPAVVKLVGTRSADRGGAAR